MEIKLRLGEADRERYGAPEEMTVDPSSISFQEIVTIQKGVDIGGVVCSFDSASQWGDAVSANDPFAMLVLIWMALKRSGIKVPLVDVDASLVELDLEVVRDPTDAGEPGKDPSTPETTS